MLLFISFIHNLNMMHTTCFHALQDVHNVWHVVHNVVHKVHTVNSMWSLKKPLENLFFLNLKILWASSITTTFTIFLSMFRMPTAANGNQPSFAKVSNALTWDHHFIGHTYTIIIKHDYHNFANNDVYFAMESYFKSICVDLKFRPHLFYL